MQKWIQHAEKPLGHSDYTEIITQICGSNNFSPDFRQMSSENITGKESFCRTFRLHQNSLSSLSQSPPETLWGTTLQQASLATTPHLLENTENTLGMGTEHTFDLDRSLQENHVPNKDKAPYQQPPST
jgi:hypothetical protein